MKAVSLPAWQSVHDEDPPMENCPARQSTSVIPSEHCLPAPQAMQVEALDPL